MDACVIFMYFKNKIIIGLFVGYNDNSKAYQVYTPRIRKVMINRDVIFDESKTGYKYLKLVEPSKDERSSWEGPFLVERAQTITCNK